MAGSYPDAPGRKMNVYGDGTVVLLGTSIEESSGQTAHAAGILAEYTATADLLELMDHDDQSSSPWGQNGGHARAIIYIFPELRDIDGSFVNTTGYDGGKIAYSPDTTNGIDGTWTNQTETLSVFQTTGTEIPQYRESIYVWTASAVRSVLIYVARSGSTFSDYVQGVELYGVIAAGQTPDRVLFINDGTGLEYIIPQDYGDIPRGSARDTTVRIKNNSGTKTANTIDVSRTNLESGQDSSGWYTFDNGAGFSASFQIASLGSGAEDPFTLRQNIPDSTTPGIYEAWAEAEVGSWT
jgi:hypothetical protein